MASTHSNGVPLQTRVLDASMSELGSFLDSATLEHWQPPRDLAPTHPLAQAAEKLKATSIPVGFPTETVYGLGADATRSAAVRGIYAAKGRPSDNPLITHVCDLSMLRSISASSIPVIYEPLIKAFWPGPLTILLPNPPNSKLAPEVTAGLSTFGVRMPKSNLALTLIKLVGRPLAAPSANASTKPSPTTAAHVLHDLDGRIELILNGGSCQVGVESTVVDGMCSPPVVLRPGGVSIDKIRQIPGWEETVKAYKDASEVGASAPRAPGMKYKHYSPKAKVVLYEAASMRETRTQRLTNTGIPFELWRLLAAKDGKISHLGLENAEWPIKVGIVTTKHWKDWAGFHTAKWSREENLGLPAGDEIGVENGNGEEDRVVVNHGASDEPRYELESFDGSWTKMMRNNPTQVVPSSSPSISNLEFEVKEGELWQGAPNTSTPMPDDWEDGSLEAPRKIADIFEIALGNEIKNIAHGLFSALRELDIRGCDVVYVEGIEDEGDIAAAVMNRLRKAATVIEK